MLIHALSNTGCEAGLHKFPSDDPVFDKLLHLLSMPGSVMMLEASVRDAHRPTTAKQVLDAVDAFNVMLPLLILRNCSGTVSALVIYASTLRKLMSIMLQPVLHKPQQQYLWNEDLADTVSALHSRLLTLISGFEGALVEIKLPSQDLSCMHTPSAQQQAPPAPPS